MDWTGQETALPCWIPAVKQHPRHGANQYDVIYKSKELPEESWLTSKDLVWLTGRVRTGKDAYACVKHCKVCCPTLRHVLQGTKWTEYRVKAAKNSVCVQSFAVYLQHRSVQLQLSRYFERFTHANN